MKKIILPLVIVFLAFSVTSTNAATVTVKNNGSSSFNKVSAKSFTKQKTSQTNITDFVNLVASTSETGGNKTNKNTGSGQSIETGVTLTEVGLTSVGGANTATDTQGCTCSCLEPASAEISGNGDHSWNYIKLGNVCIDKLTQFNATSIVNSVNTVSNTGDNSSNKNTGGESSIVTGGTSTTVLIDNSAGVNNTN